MFHMLIFTWTVTDVPFLAFTILFFLIIKPTRCTNFSNLFLE